MSAVERNFILPFWFQNPGKICLNLQMNLSFRKPPIVTLSMAFLNACLDLNFTHVKIILETTKLQIFYPHVIENSKRILRNTKKWKFC